MLIYYWMLFNFYMQLCMYIPCCVFWSVISQKKKKIITLMQINVYVMFYNLEQVLIAINVVKLLIKHENVDVQYIRVFLAQYLKMSDTFFLLAI